MSKPRSQQQLDGPPARFALAGLNFEQLLRDVNVHGHVGIDFPHTQRRLAQILQGDGAQAVKCGSGALGGRTCAALGAPLGADALFERTEKCVGVGCESRLLGFKGAAAEIAGLVQSRQESEADAGDGRRVADRFP